MTDLGTGSRWWAFSQLRSWSIRIPKKMPFILVYSLVFAAVLTSLPLYAFVDRHNYMIYAHSSDVILAAHSREGVLSLLMNEPLWLLINMSLSSFLPPEVTLQVLIFVPAFLVAFLFMKAEPRYAILIAIYLLLPSILKAHTVNLRQGAAISVFMLGYFAPKLWIRVALIAAAGFVHSSLFMIAMLIASANIPHIGRSLSIGVYGVFGAAGAVVAAASLTFFATLLGARQGEIYGGDFTSAQGMNVIVWAGLLILFLTCNSKFKRDNFVAILGLVFYLSLLLFTQVAGRMLENIVFIIILSGLSLVGWRFLAFNAWVISYLIVAYASRPDHLLPGWISL